jgi:hypothetical protein
VPAIPEIYDLAGYPAMVEKYGPSYSYQLCPRANIFRRDQDTVVDLQTFKDILRYNDYLNDPYSGGNPCNTICCRVRLAGRGNKLVSGVLMWPRRVTWLAAPMAAMTPRSRPSPGPRH